MTPSSSDLSVPRTQLRKRTELAIDARCCVTSGCRFLQIAQDPASGRQVRSCGAAIFKAALPAEALQAEVRRNPSPVPGSDADHNPFLLRLLMSPDCVRPECGVAALVHTEKVLVVDQAETESGLFRR